MKKIIKKIINKSRYIFSTKIYNIYNHIKIKYKIMSHSEMINKITIEGYSLSRFGDGEFEIIFNEGDHPGFQETNDKLAKELKKVLTSNDEKIIIAIQSSINSIDDFRKKTKNFYRFFYYRNRKKIEKMLNPNKLYGDTLLTRFYIDYADKSKTKEKVENLKKIWDNKKILIVEGRNSKLGLGNDLFNNSKEIRRILVPNCNAYKIKDKINRTIKKNVKKDELVLLAIGPTATIIAWDLNKIGIQALDIGHIDIEYEWYLSGTEEKIEIVGKNVNEVDRNINENISVNDEEYLKSIIEDISEI